MRDLTQRMQNWRDGLISNGEILSFLLEAQAEVIICQRLEEDKASEERFRKAGIIS